MTRLALLEMCNGVSRWYSPKGAAKLSLEQIADHFSSLALALVRAARDGRPLTIADLDVPSSAYYLQLAIEIFRGRCRASRRRERLPAPQ
jgi:hypothetical protein